MKVKGQITAEEINGNVVVCLGKLEPGDRLMCVDYIDFTTGEYELTIERGNDERTCNRKTGTETEADEYN